MRKYVHRDQEAMLWLKVQSGKVQRPHTIVIERLTVAMLEWTKFESTIYSTRGKQANSDIMHTESKHKIKIKILFFVYVVKFCHRSNKNRQRAERRKK